MTDDEAIASVRTCIRDAMQRPGGPTVGDVAQAMHLFVAGCWLRETEKTNEHTVKIARLDKAMYGDPETGQGGLLDLKHDLCRLVRVAAWIGGAVGAICVSGITWLLLRVLERVGG